MKSLRDIFKSFSGCNLLLAATAFVLPTSSFKPQSPDFYSEVMWIVVGIIFAGLFTTGKWIMMIPVLSLAVSGGFIFIPKDLSIPILMLRGLSAGITCSANLILIRRFVDSKMKGNAVALSCAFRVLSGIIVPVVQELDELYLGCTLIFLALMSGALITACGPANSRDRQWDDYYESYFERNSRSTEGNSWWSKCRHFLLILGIRMPNILLNNHVTKAIQLGFLHNFSTTVTVALCFLIPGICIAILLTNAFKQPPSSATSSSALKYVLLPCFYCLILLLLVNIPLIYLFLQEKNGIFLLAIIIINILLELVRSGGLFYLLDTLLVRSNLSNCNLSTILALEYVFIIFLENLFNYSHLLPIITIEGYYAAVAAGLIVSLLVYHKDIDRE